MDQSQAVYHMFIGPLRAGSTLAGQADIEYTTA